MNLRYCIKTISLIGILVFSITGNGQTIDDAYNMTKNGHFQEGLNLAQSILQKDSLNHDDMALGLDYGYLGLIYDNSSQYALSIDYTEKGLKLLSKSGLLQNSVELNMKGVIVNGLIGLNQLAKAAEVQKEIVDKRIEVDGADSQATASDLNLLGFLYGKIYDYTNAIACYEKALEIKGKIYDAHSDEYLNTLHGLAMQYLAVSKYEQAIKCLTQVADLVKENLGTSKSEYWQTLGSVAYAYSMAGQWAKALDLGTQVVAHLELMLDKTDPSLITGKGNLAKYYQQSGNYQAAAKIYEDTKDVISKAWGENNELYLTTCNNLSVCYADAGEYQKAIEEAEKVIGIRKELHGEKDPNYAKVLSNLGNCYAKMGDYGKAITLEKQSLEIKKSTIGEQNEDYLMSLNKMANYLSNTFRYVEAIEIQQKVCDIAANLMGSKHPFHINSLLSLAGMLRDVNLVNTSIETYQLANKLALDAEGAESLDYANGLQGIALDYYRLKDYQTGIETEEKALAIINSKLGSNSREYLASLSNLASAYAETGDCAAAEKYFSEYFAKKLDFIKSNLLVLPDAARRSFWYENDILFAECVAMARTEPGTSGNARAYDAVLWSKRFLLDYKSSAKRAIRSHLSAETAPLYTQIEDDTKKLIALYKMSGKDAEIDSLRDVIEKNKARLMQLTPELAQSMKIFDYSWQDVKRALHAGEVAIEFFCDKVSSVDHCKYVALVIGKDYAAPKLIELCSDSLLRAKRHTWAEYYDLFWEPLEGVVQGATKIYFSPCDTLNVIPLEVIGLDREINAERLAMYRLTSTRELLERGPASSLPHHAALFGGLTYAATDGEPASAQDRRQTAAERGGKRASLDDISSDTKAEVDNIALLLDTVGGAYTKYTGKEGNEQTFRNLTGSHVDLIHLATHGYYYSIRSFYRGDIPVPGYAKSGLDVYVRKWEENSLSRTGLIFSSVQEKRDEIPDSTDAQDGYVSGLDISNLEFPELNFVILSACETGRGDTFDADGIMGLQSAFKMAGAKSLMLSLWQVDSEATMLFMTEFYRHYLRGEGKLPALRKAQDYLKNYKEQDYSSPTYWAAFVLIDALD